MLYEYFVCLCLVYASVGREIMCLWFYPGLVWVPGDAVLATFLLTFLLTTFMVAQSHKKLCYVERGCYMNILFVSAWFVPVEVPKLCTRDFLHSGSSATRRRLLPTVDVAI